MNLLRIRPMPVTLVCIIILTVVCPIPAAAQDDPLTLPFVLVVRDMAGVPLKAVELEVYTTFPEEERISGFLTDELGETGMYLPEGAYSVRFVESWRGRAFAPVEEQAPDQMEPGISAGFGFVITREAPIPNTYFFIVLQRKDGYLYPLLDRARSHDEAPEPLHIPEEYQDVLLLEPLNHTVLSVEEAAGTAQAGGSASATPTVSTDPTETAASVTPQVVENTPLDDTTEAVIPDTPLTPSTIDDAQGPNSPLCFGGGLSLMIGAIVFRKKTLRSRINN